MEEKFIFINKPVGWTSFDVVAYIRNHIRKSGYPYIRKLKVGHAGTLDPFATGLLIVGVGREATRRLDEFKNLPKTYIATLRLGAVSDTFDRDGNITKYEKNINKILNIKYWILKNIFQKNNIQYPISNISNIDIEKIQNVLNKFIGKIKQTPPMFSAKKVKGKKLYELARKGITIRRKKNKIEIYKLELLNYDPKSYILNLKAEVSSGTYIRSLANDIGKKLGCGAYCEKLVRTRIGKYKIEDAIDVKNLTSVLPLGQGGADT